MKKATLTKPLVPVVEEPAPHVAEQHDFVRYTTLKKRVVRQIEQEFFSSRLGNCRHVLELGCGTGEITAAVASGRDVVAIDISDKMLTLGRLKLRSLPVKLLKLNMFDLDRLTIAFDAVIASRAFLHLNHASLHYMLRLSANKIRPGGRVIFDVQRPNLMQRFAKRLDRRKIRDFNVHVEELRNIIATVPELRLLEIRYFDHYLPLFPAIALPGSLADGRIGTTLRHTDSLLGRVPMSAMRLGVVCERQ